MTIPGRLPFWQTVYEAHFDTFGSVTTLIRIGLLWVLLLIVFDGVIHWVNWPSEQAAIAQGRMGSLTLLFASSFAWTLFGSCVAVPWHRFVLRGEVVKPADVSLFTPALLRYFGWALVLSAVIMGPTVFMLHYSDATLATAVDPPMGDAPENGLDVSIWLIPISVVLVFAVVTVLAFIPVRLSLVLPATAISRRDFGALGSWLATRHNFWRIYLGIVLTMATPIVFLSLWIVTTGIEAPGARAAAALSGVVPNFIFFFAGMVTVTFLSLAYRKLVRDPATIPTE
jgi:hypothetical protein